jgi:anti-sigma-K factor RskA
MNTPEAFHIDEDDLIQYALGSLRETQLGTMTAHISFCNTCRDELARIQVDLASFASVQPMEQPPAGARERFLNRLTSDKAAESRFVQMRNKSRLYVMTKSFQSWLETPMPLKILSGTLAAALVFMVYDDLGHIHELRQLMPQVQRLEDQSAQAVSLHEGALSSKSPEGHALYSAATGRLVFTASNMPTPPVGKAYELWLLPASGKPPIPAGIFTPDLQGNGAVVFPELPSNIQAGGFGVTLENSSGSPTPTSPILISGQ